MPPHFGVEASISQTSVLFYRGADKSLARPNSPCILFDGENISFDASLVIYINSTNIPPIMIINRIYETQSSVAVTCFLPGRAKDLSAPLYKIQSPHQGSVGRVRVAGMATPYALEIRGSNLGVARFSAPVYSSPGLHPAPNKMGTLSLQDLKYPKRRIDNPPLSDERLRKEYSTLL